jgi:hypothetical protein
MPTLDLHRAAQILCDAAYLGDAKTAEKWKITTRTIESYRSRLRTDPQLAGLFGTLRVKLEEDWRSGLAQAIKTGVQKMTRLIELAPEGDTFDAKALEAVTNAVKVLTEIQITTDILNAGDVPKTLN